MSLSFSYLGQFFRRSLFLTTLSVLRNTGQLFFLNTPKLWCLLFSSWLENSYVFWKENHSGKCHSHHIISRIYTIKHDLSLFILTVMLTLRSCWSGFYTVLFGEKPLCHMSYILIWLLVDLIFLSISRYQYRFPLIWLKNTVIKLMEL